MGQFRYLTEARIQDFERRKEAGEVMPSRESGDGQSLESMLLDEIITLRGRLRDVSDPGEKKELGLKIQGLETQLLVMFESSGRPLAARIMSERLEKIAQES